jgi:large subunit ribosomal protein L21
MFAVLTTGGKQYKVSQGDRLRVEKIDAPVGENIELTNVNMLGKDDGVVVDAKVLASAKVVAKVTFQGKGKKIRVFKMKRRKNYSRTQGHRQLYTELQINEIKG